MKEYEFILKYKLPDVLIDPIEYVEKLAELNCTDALVGVGKEGFISFDFTREAESAFEAIISAIKAITTVIPGAEFIEAHPDLVGFSDIADLLGVTRQRIRKIMIDNQKTFPLPIHIGNPSLWHFRNVLEWFTKYKQKENLELYEVSMITKFLNASKDISIQGPPPREFLELV